MIKKQLYLSVFLYAAFGCSSPIVAQENRTEEDAPQPVHTEAGLWEKYQVYKLAATANTNAILEGHGDNSSRDFGYCAERDFSDHFLTDQTIFSYVSVRASWARERLRLLGFPRESYEQHILEYEQKFFRHFISSDEPAPSIIEVVRNIEEWRVENRPDLDDLQFNVGCSSPGSELGYIKSDPKDGTINFINGFLFELCRAQNIDAWSIADCAGWSQSDESEPHHLFGLYVYQVRWADGSSGRGKKRMRGGNSPSNLPTFTVGVGDFYSEE